MTSSETHDLASALAKSLGLDGQSGAQTCPTNGYEPLDGPNDKEIAHLKVRVHLHDDKEFHLPAVEPAIDAATRQAVHEVDHGSDGKRAVGWRLVRTVAFGVLTSVVVGAVYAWQFYGDVQRTQMADSAKLVSTKSSSSNVIPVRLASKTSDRVPPQDQATVPILPPDQAVDRVPTQDQAAVTVLPAGQASVAPGPSPELKQKFETMVSDIAVVRQIVERLATVQEQMAVDVAMLQKSGQRASLLPHSPAVPAPSRKYAPNIARSDAVAHLPSAAIPAAPAQRRSALQ